MTVIRIQKSLPKTIIIVGISYIKREKGTGISWVIRVSSGTILVNCWILTSFLSVTWSSPIYLTIYYVGYGSRRNRIKAIMMNSPADDNDATKQQTQSSTTLLSSPPPIRVITFDLDNTLWNTTATIDAANDALAMFLRKNNIIQSQRTEIIMEQLFQNNKTRYCPMATTGSESEAEAPVLLTNLRKDALQQILIQDNGYSQDDAQEFANLAFQKVSTYDTSHYVFRWTCC